jgi:hypothetical protein
MTPPREMWHPVLLPGIRPWDMDRLWPDELEAISNYLEKMSG